MICMECDNQAEVICKIKNITNKFIFCRICYSAANQYYFIKIVEEIKNDKDGYLIENIDFNKK